MAQITASVVVAVVAGMVPLAAQTSLSIYGDGRVVVRRTLPQSLDKGKNTLTLKLDELDAATLFSPDSSVAVLSAVLRPATDEATALRRAVGQTLAFVRARTSGGADTVRATVLRTDPAQFRLSDGRVLFSSPGDPLFPSDLVSSVPEATVTLEATRARPRTDLVYVIDGAARWQAGYQVVLQGARCQVSGSATITSASLRADSAEVQLVAGSINRARPAAAPRPAFLQRGAVQLQEMVVTGGAAGEETVGETHVYQLPGRPSVVPGALPWRGFFAQSPAEPDRVPVQVWYTLKRPRATPFGDRPLPGGTVQVFQADSGGRLQLVGEARSDHTAPGRDLRVQSGDAFDVTAERVQTDYNQEQLAPPKRGMTPRQRITAAYKVTIANAKPESVSVDVREARFGTWRVTESSLSAEKLSATEVRFRVSVPAGGEATLTYTVQAES